MMATQSFFAKVIVILCLLWFVSFPLLGGGKYGKEMFATWASDSFLQDSKAGVPIVMLAFPILFAGSVSSIFATNPVNRQEITQSNSRLQLGGIASSCCQPHQQKFRIQPWLSLTLLVFLPSLIYVVSSMHRHLSGKVLSTDKKLMDCANVFGMVAVIALSWVFVSPSRDGPIAKLFAWDPIRIVQLFHAWSGRVVVLGGLIHGAMHTLRFALQGRQVLMSYFFPPISCWTLFQSHTPAICEEDNKKDGCSCYDHFLPLTGWVAGVGLALIGISSLYRVRRTVFSLFAILHYFLTPLTYAAICVHYNKTILYSAGGLLYYLASNYPMWMECLVNRRLRQQSVKVVSIEKIDADSMQSNRPCIAVTMEASEDAIQQYRPAVYCRLLVPRISPLAHPFTVNRVPNQPRRIRIIFRVTGTFTRSLGNALLQNSTNSVASLVGKDKEGRLQEHVFPPESSTLGCVPLRIYLSGFYGSGRLLDQVSFHDVCVIVAAGVGITPYLSVILALPIPSPFHEKGRLDGLRGEVSASPPKKIVVHWICRDESLIRYCQKEYIDPYIQKITRPDDTLLISINIHHTGAGHNAFLDQHSIEHGNIDSLHNLDVAHSSGEPFELSKFSSGLCVKENLGYFTAFSLLSWGGVSFIWKWYHEHQDAKEFLGRMYTLVTVLLYGLVVAALANACWYLDSVRRHRGWSPVANNEEDQNESRFNDDPEGDAVELSEYKDSTNVSLIRPVLNVRDEQASTMNFQMFQGRPHLDEILGVLHDGTSPALFCCVPANLAKNLHDKVVTKNVSSCSPRVSFYEESFEL